MKEGQNERKEAHVPLKVLRRDDLVEGDEDDRLEEERHEEVLLLLVLEQVVEGAVGDESQLRGKGEEGEKAAIAVPADQVVKVKVGTKVVLKVLAVKVIEPRFVQVNLSVE